MFPRRGLHRHLRASALYGVRLDIDSRCLRFQHRRPNRHFNCTDPFRTTLIYGSRRLVELVEVGHAHMPWAAFSSVVRNSPALMFHGQNVRVQHIRIQVGYCLQSNVSDVAVGNTKAGEFRTTLENATHGIRRAFSRYPFNEVLHTSVGQQETPKPVGNSVEKTALASPSQSLMKTKSSFLRFCNTLTATDRSSPARPPNIPRSKVSVTATLKTLKNSYGGRGGVVVRLLASHLGEPDSIPGGVTPGFSHSGIVPDDAAGWRVFLGISRSSRPFVPTLLHTYLALPSLALKASTLRAARCRRWVVGIADPGSFDSCSDLPPVMTMNMHVTSRTNQLAIQPNLIKFKLQFLTRKHGSVTKHANNSSVIDLPFTNWKSLPPYYIMRVNVTNFLRRRILLSMRLPEETHFQQATACFSGYSLKTKTDINKDDMSWTVKIVDVEESYVLLSFLYRFGLQGITAEAGSGLLEMCFFRKSHTQNDPAPKEISDIDSRDIICWKTFPVHEGKIDNTAVISVFGNATMFSRKKLKFELGDQIWLYRKLVGTTVKSSAPSTSFRFSHSKPLSLAHGRSVARRVTVREGRTLRASAAGARWTARRCSAALVMDEE
ncbi:hypothetical protein PR048_031318 [Dryococelus australis]|uniref:Uncharacterized protein n=1 Tax=Dryococelus australis TaxID=614101 RepID=A0ABQ9G4X5_9NEOP|nr:hypothetical protein PR048_031318 [Dryococelus australis]